MMAGAGRRRKPWHLSTPSWRALLEFLDPDPDRGAEQYEKIREKLIRLFEWRGCVPGVDYVDEAFDRVARRLEEGLEQKPENPYLFLHGVALNVIRERWRAAPRDPEPLEGIPESQTPSVNPLEVERMEMDASEKERRLACLEECLDALTPLSRELLTEYHLGPGGSRIARRKELSEMRQLPAGALRLRVYRIRRQLQRCVRKCAKPWEE